MRFILIVIPFFVAAVSVFGETRNYKKTEDVINRILDRTDAVQEKSQTEGVQQKDLPEQLMVILMIPRREQTGTVSSQKCPWKVRTLSGRDGSAKKRQSNSMKAASSIIR